jgi:hypothetical protein
MRRSFQCPNDWSVRPAPKCAALPKQDYTKERAQEWFPNMNSMVKKTKIGMKK